MPFVTSIGRKRKKLTFQCMLSEATCCHFHSSVVHVCVQLVFTGNSAIENVFICIIIISSSSSLIIKYGHGSLS